MKSTYCEYILEKILSTSEVGPILALIAPSPLSLFLVENIRAYRENLICLISYFIPNCSTCILLLDFYNKRWIKSFVQ